MLLFLMTLMPLLHFMQARRRDDERSIRAAISLRPSPARYALEQIPFGISRHNIGLYARRNGIYLRERQESWMIIVGKEARVSLLPPELH